MSDPLQRIEGQVMVAARRYSARRRRRRRRSVAILAAVATLGLVSAASALTGAGPIELLSKGPAPPSVEPVAGQPRVQVSAVGLDGSGWTMRAHRKPDGGFCMQAPPFGTADVTAVACAPADILADDLRRAGVHLSVGYPGDDINLVFGIARGDASGVTIGRPGGPESSAALSEEWAEADGVPLRAFLAVVTGPPPTAADPMQVEVTLRDGRELRSAMPPQR